MNLFLLRHAIAVERGTQRYTESRRPLTPEGRRKMQQAARGMKALELSFDCLLSSPYRRARETAEIVARTFKLGPKLAFTKHLAPEAEARLLIQDLVRRSRVRALENVLLVGHEPDLSLLAAKLIGGPQGLGLKFKKGALCKLVAEKLRWGACAHLEWLLTASQLKKVR